MWRWLTVFLVVALSAIFFPAEILHAQSFSQKLCDEPDYYCIKVEKGQTWESLWPDSTERDIVKRINRTNRSLSKGMMIAVPMDLGVKSVLGYAPFDPTLAVNQKTIIVDLAQLAWGAYNENGNLISWGPLSGGKSYCSDVKRGCRTPSGTYTIYSKRGEGCVSSKFPVGRGGAPMPYCMFFRGGYALHGSPNVPGYHASHGCVRIFKEDARWLNQEFINMPSQGGTRVIVKPYAPKNSSPSVWQE